MEYYSVLELKRDASDADIKQSYRRLAVIHHPDKNVGKKREFAEKMFRDLAEAYEVLSDPQRRSRYDQLGEAGLKQSLPNGKGGFTPGWSFSKSPDQVFTEFFGSQSPFLAIPSEGVLSVGTPHPLAKQDPLTVDLPCSLEELYHGTSKQVRVTRKKLDGNNGVRLDEGLVAVDVQPGWKAGTKITFPGEGHEAPGSQPGDLVFILREKPHARFVRRDKDLVYRASISLLQALCGGSISITTLDNRVLSLAIDHIVSPGFTQTVPNEGMPNPRAPAQKGNLIVEFDVSYPKQLSEQQKILLAQILPK